jgi:hypothetical protein
MGGQGMPAGQYWWFHFGGVSAFFPATTIIQRAGPGGQSDAREDPGGVVPKFSTRHANDDFERPTRINFYSSSYEDEMNGVHFDIHPSI